MLTIKSTSLRASCQDLLEKSGISGMCVFERAHLPSWSWQRWQFWRKRASPTVRLVVDAADAEEVIESAAAARDRKHSTASARQSAQPATNTANSGALRQVSLNGPKRRNASI